MAEVVVDGREWVKILRVCSISKRVIACFCEGLALVLYVYLTDGESGAGGDDEDEDGGGREAVLTVSKALLKSCPGGFIPR